MYDLIVIGGGVAGMSAGIYAARGNLKTVIYEKTNFGGELAQIIHIANYPGYDGRGDELALKMRQQAEAAGVEFDYGECREVRVSGKVFDLTIDERTVRARSVLIATGNEPRRLEYELDVPASYCSLCDAPLVKGKNIAVIGGGDSAVQEAIELSHIAKQVTIISRSKLRASPKLQSRALELPNLQIRENNETTKEELEDFEHVFVFIGHLPATKFLPEDVLAADGTVMTGAGVKELSSSLDMLGLDDFARRSDHETLIPGLFAAGDVRFGAVRQVVAAAADGAAAAIEIMHYLDATG